jgi:chromosome segregation ATPase
VPPSEVQTLVERNSTLDESLCKERRMRDEADLALREARAEIAALKERCEALRTMSTVTSAADASTMSGMSARLERTDVELRRTGQVLEDTQDELAAVTRTLDETRKGSVAQKVHFFLLKM